MLCLSPSKDIHVLSSSTLLVSFVGLCRPSLLRVLEHQGAAVVAVHSCLLPVGRRLAPSGVLPSFVSFGNRCVGKLRAVCLVQLAVLVYTLQLQDDTFLHKVQQETRLFSWCLGQETAGLDGWLPCS